MRWGWGGVLFFKQPWACGLVLKFYEGFARLTESVTSRALPATPGRLQVGASPPLEKHGDVRLENMW